VRLRDPNASRRDVSNLLTAGIRADVEASEASAGSIEERLRAIQNYERRADLHERRALEHGAQGRVELARTELELARWERGEALARRAALDESDRTWATCDGANEARARRWYLELTASVDRAELARRVVRQVQAWGLTCLADVAMAVDALVITATRRGRARVLGLVKRHDSLTLEVHNDGAVVAPGRPRHDLVGPGASAVFDAIASHWGWRPTGTGIAVWCQLPTTA
jgi:hypothetical protein